MVLELHPDHKKYVHAKPAHEAGFDSYLTAKILIRLSTKLETAGQQIDLKTNNESKEPAINTGQEHKGVLPASLILPLKSQSTNRTISSKHDKSHENGTSTSEPPHLTHTTTTPTPSPYTNTKPKKPKQHHPKRPPSRRTPFSHATMFDLLGDISSEEDPASPSSPPTGKGSASPRTPMMPPFETEFWNVYADKLRVNGTAEGVCCLVRDGGGAEGAG